jgi:flagellar export protein FliJ
MHAFSGQLDDALRLQQQRIDAAAAELERRIEDWTEVRRQEQAMERLVGRFAGDEARQAARAEQRVADDDGLTRRRESEHRD